MRVIESWANPKRPQLRTVLLAVDSTSELEPGGRFEASGAGIHGRILAMRPVNSPQMGMRAGESVMALDLEVDA